MEELFEEEKKKPILTKKNTKSVCMCLSFRLMRVC